MVAENIHPIYNISSDPKKQNRWLIELQLLIDSGQNLNQIGSKSPSNAIADLIWILPQELFEFTTKGVVRRCKKSNCR